MKFGLKIEFAEIVSLLTSSMRNLLSDSEKKLSREVRKEKSNFILCVKMARLLYTYIFYVRIFLKIFLSARLAEIQYFLNPYSSIIRPKSISRNTSVRKI